MKVLIVDDDEWLRKRLVQLAGKLGHTATEAGNAWEAFDELETSTFDAIVTDVQMPDGNGIELLQILRRLDVQPPTYVHSSEAKFHFQRENLDLAIHIPKVFGAHTSFTLKDAEMDAKITAFLNSLQTP